MASVCSIIVSMNPHSQPRVFTVIQSQYSVEVLQLVRSYITLRVKLVRQKEQLTFSIRCKHFQLLPDSLTVKPLVKTPEGRKIAKQTSFRIF